MTDTTSERVRARVVAAGKRFHANDNIHEFIEPGDLEAMQEEVADAMRAVLKSLVIDIESDHNTQETARRVAKMFVQEVFAGRYRPQPRITQFPNVSGLDELMIVGPITVRSACSHHLCPIIGKVWVGVMPNEDSALIGLSKYARLVEWVMTRPQIQEEAVDQLASLLQGRPLLHAVARRQRHGFQDDQQHHARGISAQRQSTTRVPRAARAPEPLGALASRAAAAVRRLGDASTGVRYH
jgi:GTP cyclohydrolase I